MRQTPGQIHMHDMVMINTIVSRLIVHRVNIPVILIGHINLFIFNEYLGII